MGHTRMRSQMEKKWCKFWGQLKLKELKLMNLLCVKGLYSNVGKLPN